MPDPVGSERPPSQGEAIELAWKALDVPPDTEGSPWAVGAAFREFFDAGVAAALSFVHQRAGEGESPQAFNEKRMDAEYVSGLIYAGKWRAVREWIDRRFPPSAQRAGEPPTPDEVERAAKAMEAEHRRWMTDRDYDPGAWKPLALARAALDAARGDWQ